MMGYNLLVAKYIENMVDRSAKELMVLARRRENRQISLPSREDEKIQHSVVSLLVF
ncbi:hypothetical protein Fmac_008185 [Flemingia macrophylla]|uniref:Uncharacterized protein n=1 Tax=Flemingia macrophylla TaxID=520843 RepID=A0ABD1MWN7_9FABA